MTRTAIQGLFVVGGCVALLAVASLGFVEYDREGIRGTAFGAGLGLLNLVVGYFLTRRTLRQGMKSAMTLVAGGFLARLFLLVVLMLLFRRTGAADPAAFALTFLVFFFVYLGIEVFLVERSLDGKGRAA